MTDEIRRLIDELVELADRNRDEQPTLAARLNRIATDLAAASSHAEREGLSRQQRVERIKQQVGEANERLEQTGRTTADHLNTRITLGLTTGQAAAHPPHAERDEKKESTS